MWLEYQIEHDPFIDYDKAPPLTFETDDFCGRAEDLTLRLELKRPVESREDAIAVVEPFLHRWRVFADIEKPGELRFVLSRWSGFPKAGTPVERAQDLGFTAAVRVQMDAALHAKRGAYPSLPEHFDVSPLVDLLHRFWVLYRQGKHQIGPVAYIFETLILYDLNPASKDKKAWSQAYAASLAVLDRYKKLVHTRGGIEGRKRDSIEGPPYTDDERLWLETVMKLFLRRAGQRAADPNVSLTKITMSDLPPI